MLQLSVWLTILGDPPHLKAASQKYTATHSVAVFADTAGMSKTSVRLPFRSPFQRLIALWVLRAFDSPSCRQAFFRRDSYADDDIAVFLGLPLGPKPEDFKAIRELMADMQLQLEQRDCRLNPSAQENFDQLASILKLSPLEQRVAELIACMQREPPLIDSLRIISNNYRHGDQTKLLSRMLKLPKNAIAAALAPGVRMVRSGLLESASGASSTRWIEFRNDEVARHLLRERFDARKILHAMGVQSVDAAELGLGNYPHLRQSLDLLIEYLKRSRSKPGINILLHGPPGTGKTQLARTLAAERSLPLFEIRTSDENGDPLNPKSRLETLNLALKFFQKEPALLVFDEAEDILTPTLLDRGAANTHKGWFNQMLGSNAQPVIWISNSIATLDPAFARRFDFIIEVPIPPRSVRGRILQEEAGGLVSARLIQQLTDLPHLAPAVVSKTGKVVKTIGKTLSKDRRDAAFAHVLGGILKAQGHPKLAAPEMQTGCDDPYDISYLNANADLALLSQRLRSRPSARLCLYGPPGTGKTAFGHWLSREIERPLLVKRGSDLLSPYVGVSEKRIAEAFERAEDDDAILMIDEVDSFLQDRSKATRSWEVTQVNELLVRMESFNGVFIATTNRLEHMDAASMRRFDLKLGFDYLKSTDAYELFGAWCRRLGIAPPDSQHRVMIESLECMTPGDLAAVARRHHFQPFSDAGGFLQALGEDCAIKMTNNRRIGYL